MLDNQEKRKRTVAPNLRQEIWDWLDTEADFLGRSQCAHLSDLITTIHDVQMGKNPPEVIEFVPDTSPNWEEMVEAEGGIYG